jgi:hypothetical protein
VLTVTPAPNSRIVRDVVRKRVCRINGSGRAEGRSTAEVVLFVASVAAVAAEVLLAEASLYAACVGEVVEVAAALALPCDGRNETKQLCQQ